jgi:hypothetical protein
MSDKRAISIDRQGELIASLDQMEAQLGPSRAAYDSVLQRLLDGQGVQAALWVEDVASNRSVMTTVLKKYE